MLLQFYYFSGVIKHSISTDNEGNQLIRVTRENLTAKMHKSRFLSPVHSARYTVKFKYLYHNCGCYTYFNENKRLDM